MGSTFVVYKKLLHMKHVRKLLLTLYVVVATIFLFHFLFNPLMDGYMWYEYDVIETYLPILEIGYGVPVYLYPIYSIIMSALLPVILPFYILTFNHLYI